jgi:hypothetical protein
VEGERLCRCALHTLETNGSKRPIEIAAILKNLGLSCFERGNVSEAEHHWLRALMLCDYGDGRKTRVFPEVLICLAKVAARQNHCDRAVELAEQALRVMDLITGGEHAELADFLETAATIFAQAGQESSAKEFVQRAHEIRSHIREIDH